MRASLSTRPEAEKLSLPTRLISVNIPSVSRASGGNSAPTDRRLEALHMNLSVEISPFSDLRRTSRERVSTSAALRGGRTRALADILDLSVEGARLSTIGPLAIGSQMSLKLPLVEALEARAVLGGRASGSVRVQQTP